MMMGPLRGGASRRDQVQEHVTGNTEPRELTMRAREATWTNTGKGGKMLFIPEGRDEELTKEVKILATGYDDTIHASTQVHT